MDQFHIHPALGTVTPIHHKRPIHFIVHIPASHTIHAAEIWTNLSSSGDWSAIPLAMDAVNQPIHHVSSNQKSFLVYRASVIPTTKDNFIAPGTYKFCARVCYGFEGEWTYIGPDGDGRDGVIILYLDGNIESPEQLFCDPCPELGNIATSSSLDDNRWWIPSFIIPASSKGTCSEHSLGHLKGVVKCVGLSRPNAWWLCPSVGNGEVTIDRDTQLLLTYNTGGIYTLIIPITNQTCSTVLCAGMDGALVFRCVNETGDVQNAKISFSTGPDLFNLIDWTMENIIQQVLGQSLRRESCKAESVYDAHLGYCTWNAFMKDVSYDLVLSSLDSLLTHGIPVRYIVIDDGWQTERDSLLQSFEANPHKFPLGLRGSIAKFRQLHPEIKVFCVWHTLWGYWRGVDPSSLLGAQFKVISVPRGRKYGFESGPDAHIVSGVDIKPFYESFYAFLADAGVDMVKVDNHGAFDNHEIAAVSEENGGPAIVAKYQDAVRRAARKRFQYRMIYCMGMCPKYFFDVYSISVPKDEERSEQEAVPVMRNSDDFFPDQPQTHPRHLWINAFNSIWTHTFQRVTPDWDMFQSMHTWAHYHAAARAISGGPIYITDKPNQHNPSLVYKLVAQRRDGDWYILRSTRSALPTLDCLFIDPTIPGNAPLKIFNINRAEDGTEWGVLGAWSGQNEWGATVITHLSLANIATFSHSDKDYAVYLMLSEHVQRLRSSTDTVIVAIDPTACEIATFAPLYSVPIPGTNATATIGCFGLIDKFNSSQPILATSIMESHDNSIVYHAHLAARSEQCGFYLEVDLVEMEYEITVEVDGQVLPTDLVRYNLERRLVVADLMGVDEVKWAGEGGMVAKETGFEILLKLWA